ncbi:MAG: dTDP-4-dehydrorhamnose reductase [Candidatus Eremiobacteraeota bacterium]|nr:dTDP-4-dehydrorhamnose reductase [Candidatus Eremiobacteraeota bacterium]
MTRVLLIGGAGRLGTAIARLWSDWEIVAPGHGELDIGDAHALRDAVERIRPDVLLNAAAFHDVDRCEDEPQRAFAVNALAVGAAAALARERDVFFVTISTDYVFDGTAREPYAETAPAHPISVYGVSKLAGEYLAGCLGSRALVVRTCGLYGTASSRNRTHLIERVLEWKPGNPPLRVVADVVASPTFAGHLADTLRRLIVTESKGLYHAVDRGPVSWFDFAREVARAAGLDVPVEPISAAQWRSRAARPRFSALDTAKLRGLGIEMPRWQAGIAAHLAARLR